MAKANERSPSSSSTVIVPSLRSPSDTSAASADFEFGATQSVGAPKERRRNSRSFAISALCMCSSWLLQWRHEALPRSTVPLQGCESSATVDFNRDRRRALRFERLLSQNLVHVARGLRAAGLADDARGHAGHRLVMRHGCEHDRSRRHPRAVTDFDVAQNFRPRADQDAMADLGMPVAGLLARAAERHALQDRDVVLDRRRLAHDQAGRVIEEYALADARGRVDVDAERRRAETLQHQREIAPPGLQEPVGQAIGLQRLEAL